MPHDIIDNRDFQLADRHASCESTVTDQGERNIVDAQQRSKLVAEGERKMGGRLTRLDQTEEARTVIEQLVRPISTASN